MARAPLILARRLGYCSSFADQVDLSRLEIKLKAVINLDRQDFVSDRVDGCGVAKDIGCGEVDVSRGTTRRVSGKQHSAFEYEAVGVF